MTMTLDDFISALTGGEVSVKAVRVAQTENKNGWTLADYVGELAQSQMVIPLPTKIIFNAPATIIYWSDGDKTIVKCDSRDEFNEEVGVAMSYVYKIYGSRSMFKKAVDKMAIRQ